jgi:pullulanase/glycogen debranching enzyme
MIVDSLRYWIGEMHVMHVDGFRFDLASIPSTSPFTSLAMGSTVSRYFGEIG